MGLHELVADQIDFSDPGYLREKHPAGGYSRYHGLSKAIGSFLCRLDEASSQSVYTVLAERSNHFIAERLPEVETLTTGEMLSVRETTWLETSAGDFSFKIFLALRRAKLAIEQYTYIVHPEEMDLLLRTAYGNAYEMLFAPQD